MVERPTASPTRSARIATAVAIALSVVLVSSVAHADLAKPSDSEALRLYQDGNKDYKVRDFTPAIEKYKASLKIEESPACLYNIAQAHRQRAADSGESETQWRDDYEAAIWFYQRLLKVTKLPKADQQKVQGFIADMRAELDKQAATKPPTEAADDGDAQPAPSDAAPAPANPTTVTTAPAAAIDVRSSPSTFTTRRKVALGIGAAGVVAIGAGVVFGLRASDLREQAAMLCPTTSCADAETANDLVARASSSARTANVAYGVGVAAVVGATVLWFLGAPSDADRSVTAAPRIAPDAVGLDVLVRF